MHICSLLRNKKAERDEYEKSSGLFRRTFRAAKELFPAEIFCHDITCFSAEGDLAPGFSVGKQGELCADPVGADRPVFFPRSPAHDNVLSGSVFDVYRLRGGLCGFRGFCGGQVRVPDISFAPGSGNVIEGRAVRQHGNLCALAEFSD